MANKLIDKVGKVYGKLTVVNFDSWHTYPSGRQRAKWNCYCQCGNNTVVLGSSLIPDGAKSCGVCCKSGSNDFGNG